MSRNLAVGDGSRGISTVLDAAIFLLLVSASVGLLYGVPQADGDATADPDVAAEATAALATSIETIEYEPAPGGETADSGPTRTDRGTIAELLAETTVANARFDAEPLTRAPSHESAVRNATRGATSRFARDVRIQVRSQWRPLPGSGLRGEVVVGADPPTDADVHAATTAVPVGTGTSAGAAQSGWIASGTHLVDGPEPIGQHGNLDHGRSRSLESIAADSGCSGLAHAIGSRVVGTTFPPERTRHSMRAGGDPAERTRRRYGTAVTALGIDPAALSLDGDLRRPNERLATALAGPFEATCAGYESPEVAARRASPGTVLVSVRTWSP